MAGRGGRGFTFGWERMDLSQTREYPNIGGLCVALEGSQWIPWLPSSRSQPEWGRLVSKVEMAPWMLTELGKPIFLLVKRARGFQKGGVSQRASQDSGLGARLLLSGPIP